MIRTTLSRRSALALGAAGLAATGAARAQEPVTIRIGFASIGQANRPFAGGSTTAVAHAAGYLEEELKDAPHVTVAWSFFKGAGPAVNEAIANDQLDLAHQGDFPALIGRANGLSTKIIMMTRAHTPVYLAAPPGSAIKSVADLAGRKVAMHRGTNLQLAIGKVLAANGLDERDLKIVNMDFAAMNAALASRDIDAGWGETNLFELVDKGLAEIVYTTKGDDPAFGRNSHLLVTEAFEQRHPELVGRVVRAITRAARWSSEEANREAMFELWAKTGVSAAVYRRDFEGDALAYRNSPLLDELIVAQYAEQARQARELRLIRREVEVPSWFEPRYLETTLRELRLEDYWPRHAADGSRMG